MDVTTGLATALAGLPDEQLADLGRCLGDAELASILRVALGRDEPRPRARAARRPKRRPGRRARPKKRVLASSADVEDAILEFVGQAGKEGAKGGEVRQAVGIDKDRCVYFLRKLRRAGKLKMSGARSGARWRLA